MSECLYLEASSTRGGGWMGLQYTLITGSPGILMKRLVYHQPELVEIDKYGRELDDLYEQLQPE